MIVCPHWVSLRPLLLATNCSLILPFVVAANNALCRVSCYFTYVLLLKGRYTKGSAQRVLLKGLDSKDPPQFMPFHKRHVCRFLLKAYHPNCLELLPLALLFFGLIIQRLLRFQSYTFFQNAMYICVPYFEEYKGRLKF